MDEILSELDRILVDTEISQGALTRAKKARDHANKAGEDAFKGLGNLEGSKASSDAFNLAIRETLDEAPKIYTREVEIAVLKNDEYAYTAFLSPLIDVGYEESLYRITPAGSGWNRSIRVMLAMDEIAGSIDDYAQAVETARDALGIKEGRDPAKASVLWREKIYQKGRYFTTIKLRLSAASDKAPFWSLLNYGNKDASMSSNIGGTAYPSRGGTHFVSNVEEGLKEFFGQSFSRYREQNKLLVEKINYDLDRLRTSIDALDVKINALVDNIYLAKTLSTEINVSSERVDTAATIVEMDTVEAQKPAGVTRSIIRSITSFVSRLFGRDD